MTTLMKRLEAATSRLEDLVELSSVPKGESSSLALSGSSSVPLSSAPTDSSSAQPALAASAPPAVKEVESRKASQFESLLPHLDALKSKAASIDPIVEKQTDAFIEVAKASIEIIRISENSLKPDFSSAEFADLFSPMSKAASYVVEIRESNRSSKFVNLLSTLSEGIPAFGWLSMPEKPADFVQEFIDSSQFYANRVLREGGDSADWAKEVLATLRELKTVVLKEFPEGLSWNASGKPLKEVLSSKKPVTGGPAPPPPPPPPPAPTPSSSNAPPAGGTTGMAAVFSDLNQGTSITKGLKKPASKAPKPAPPPKPASLKHSKTPGVSDSKPAKPPAKTLVESRWIVENFVDCHDIIIEAEMNQSILVDNCVNSTIQVKGKANSVSVNKCRKSGVLVENLVSSVSIVKCDDCGLQVTGTLPSLTLDQSHSCNVYLSKQALDVDIYTSQTSTININLPTGEDGDYKEVPLAEQIIHKVDKSGLAVNSRAVGAHEH